ncbi:MAG TPA: VWA domain-containing protein [Spirochaetia bacterium]|nr:VWA domain-containing protein [Spirochaetia bacterium]
MSALVLERLRTLESAGSRAGNRSARNGNLGAIRRQAESAADDGGGRRVRTVSGPKKNGLAVAASLRNTALRLSGSNPKHHDDSACPGQVSPGSLPPRENRLLRREDLRYYRYKRDPGDLVILLVDASDSMATGAQLAAAKLAAVRILTRRTRSQSRVALLAFRDRGARILMPPTAASVLAARPLARLSGGGATPLAAALLKAIHVMDCEGRRAPFRRGFIVLLSDGEGNVRLPGLSSEREELRFLSRRVRERNLILVCVDTADVEPRRGLPWNTPMKRFARELGGAYVSVTRPETDLLSMRWRRE